MYIAGDQVYMWQTDQEVVDLLQQVANCDHHRVGVRRLWLKKPCYRAVFVVLLLQSESDIMRSEKVAGAREVAEQ